MNTMLRTLTAAALLIGGLYSGPVAAGAAPPAPLPDITITENPGNYDVTIAQTGAGSPWYLHAFAVGNNGIVDTTTARIGWNSTILDQATWDAGYFVDGNNGTGFDTDDFGAFASIFGSDTQALLYWFDVQFNPETFEFGFAMGPNETDGSFFFEQPFVASEWVAFVSIDSFEPTDVQAIYSLAQVPEPMTAGIFGVALAGLGLLRRRARIARA